MSGQSKYTPGPWIYYADLPLRDPNWHIVTTANKMRVLANVHIEPGNAMDEANACLIAAAPDLLEAAELAMEGIEVLDLLIASVEEHGNYSVESTLGFLNQARCAKLRLSEAIAAVEARS